MMEEQSSDIEVTVKTLDSQSRTYTVASQVGAHFLRLVLGTRFYFLSAFAHGFLSDCLSADSEGVQGAHRALSGHPCG